MLDRTMQPSVHVVEKTYSCILRYGRPVRSDRE